MKIQYVIGNIVDAVEPCIAHGCNAQGVMGSGVAKALRDKWPVIFEKYRQRYDIAGLQLGCTIFVKAADDKIVANCITQKFYGRDGDRYVDYDAIRKCMKHLNNIHTVAQQSEYGKITSVALPMIGAGLGGGDWSIILQIIEEEMTEVQPVVYILNEKDVPHEATWPTWPKTVTTITEDEYGNNDEGC